MWCTRIPNWDWRSFDLERDSAKANAIDKDVDELDPHLAAFAKHGGKLLIYHGWADQQVAPGASIEFYKSVVSLSGDPAQASNWIRLFMVPGWDTAQVEKAPTRSTRSASSNSGSSRVAPPRSSRRIRRQVRSIALARSALIHRLLAITAPAILMTPQISLAVYPNKYSVTSTRDLHSGPNLSCEQFSPELSATRKLSRNGLGGNQ